MKLLVIGTDTAIFQPGSDARGRVEAYGRLFDELHVIIYSPREPRAKGAADANGLLALTGQASPRLRGEQIAPNVWLYPTNSRWFLQRPFDALRIGHSIARERAIDAVSVQDPAESGIAGWFLKRSMALPFHIQLHADFLSPHFRRNSWKERMRYYLAKFIIPRGDAFRAVSERIRHSLDSRFKIPAFAAASAGRQNSKIDVLPIFVDRDAIARAEPVFDLRARYPEFDFIVLVVSRLMREKNVGLALEAFAEFCKEFPKAGMVVVGDGPEAASLKCKARSLKLDERVRFEGSQQDVVSYYKTADLYVLTSNFEGYARTVIEAAAAGLPVAMTDVGVAGDSIRDRETGRVVPVGDREALVRALVEARRNYPEMRRMAELAKREVLAAEPRTREQYLERYRQSYENILRH